MKYLFRLLLIFITASNIISYAQESSKLTITYGDNSHIVSVLINDGYSYISLMELSDVLKLNRYKSGNYGEILVEIDGNKISFTADNPFVIKYSDVDTVKRAFQLTHSPIIVDENLFTPLTETLELLNGIIDQIIIQISPTKIQIVNRNHDGIDAEPRGDSVLTKNTITVKISEESDKTTISILSSSRSPVFSNFFSDNNLHLVLWDVVLTKDSVIESTSNSFIKKIEINPSNEFTELVFYLSIDDVMAQHIQGENKNEFSILIRKREYGDWFYTDSEHFRCIYRDSHSHLVNHILSSAEQSLRKISQLFNYEPSERIIINTYDVSDYGYGGTTSIPLNFIRLEIEPLEPGYEVVPYNERFQWLLSHELVHIAVNDGASGIEKFFRSVFGKVNPDKNRPLTIPFSLLTGHNRYTPRWHQEASAVYLETWLSGGFGRVLGNFDEMYFRSLVFEDKNFPGDVYLDGILGHESFLIETLYYIYGGRFITHLAIKYGNKKIIRWFAADDNEFYPGYKGKFKDIFNINFNSAWNDFIKEEKEFQKKNIQSLTNVRLTEHRILSEEPFGFVTQPYYSKKMNSMIFGYHRSHELATLKQFELGNFKNSKKITSLQTPSAIGVASTAFDDSLDIIFYTTNNNQLYRDIRLYDLKSNDDIMLFEDCRTGHLTISSGKHELWGIQHNAGNAILVKSEYPFQVLETMVIFETGDEIQQLSVNNKGDFLAAILHRSNGNQSIIISDLSNIKNGGKFQFSTISSSGSPENPSWSSDDNYLVWNAYTNGVSNIYRCDLRTGEVKALTHNVTGFFKPVYISEDSLFVFEFTTEGLKPSLIANLPAERLPAINYLGQQVIDKNPEVIDWALQNISKISDQSEFSDQKKFNSINNLQIQTFIPTISGFQKSKVLGIFSQISDPLLRNEISIEAGISPFKEIMNKIRFHLKFKYDIHQRFYVAAEHNPADFFDLFNDRKRGTLGNRFAVGHNDFWLYDNPLKIKQTTELSYYTDTRFINDNLTEASEPDFFVFRTEFEYKNLRRTIGSFDFEHGNHIKFHLQGFGADMEKFEVAPGTYLEWDYYSLYLMPHNILRLKFSAGYHYLNEQILQAQFFFGGFGNREVENEPVRQYEKVFRFPGVPIYSIPTDNFLKIMVSNIFPPLRFDSPEILGHYIKNINLSLFSQGLITGLPSADKWVDAGAQLNIMFSHWYNLESTLSAGFAKAWWKGGNDTEWFISYKILRD